MGRRGTLEAPGRVVTLLQGEKDDEVFGMLYRISAAEADRVLAQLHVREKAGYKLEDVVVHCDDGVTRPAQVFWATTDNEFYLGEAHPEVIAETILRSHGESGTNIEYFENLLAWLRERSLHDTHVEEIAAEIARLRRDADGGSSSVR